jgi:hypothetical protein
MSRIKGPGLAVEEILLIALKGDKKISWSRRYLLSMKLPF